MSNFLNHKPWTVIRLVQVTLIQIDPATTNGPLSGDIPSFLNRHRRPQIVPLSKIQFFSSCRFHFTCLQWFTRNFVNELVPVTTGMSASSLHGPNSKEPKSRRLCRSRNNPRNNVACRINLCCFRLTTNQLHMLMLLHTITFIVENCFHHTAVVRQREIDFIFSSFTWLHQILQHLQVGQVQSDSTKNVGPTITLMLPNCKPKRTSLMIGSSINCLASTTLASWRARRKPSSPLEAHRSNRWRDPISIPPSAPLPPWNTTEPLPASDIASSGGQSWTRSAACKLWSTGGWTPCPCALGIGIKSAAEDPATKAFFGTEAASSSSSKTLFLRASSSSWVCSMKLSSRSLTRSNLCLPSSVLLNSEAILSRQALECCRCASPCFAAAHPSQFAV